MSRLQKVTESLKDIPLIQGRVFSFLKNIPCTRGGPYYLALQSNIFGNSGEFRHRAALLIKDPSCLG